MGRVRCVFVNGDLQEEVGKMMKKREHIDEKARAIRDTMVEFMPWSKETVVPSKGAQSSTAWPPG